MRRGDFISVISGIHETSIITNERNLSSVKKIVLKDVKNISKSLSSVTLNIPENSTEMIGLFYLITKGLSWDNISIVEIISTWSETSYIVKSKDSTRAYDCVKKIIEENK